MTTGAEIVKNVVVGVGAKKTFVILFDTKNSLANITRFLFAYAVLAYLGTV
jgi:hypothetical protein